MRLVVRELPTDSGEVILAKDKTLGYLAQYQEVATDLTVYDELLTTKQYIFDFDDQIHQLERHMKHATGSELESMMDTYTRLTHSFELENGYAYRSGSTGVLKGLGFEEADFQKQVTTLSGGQKTRVALGKLLLSQPDILLLDEPTKHPGYGLYKVVETYHPNYPGAVLIVSHDRYFLDRVVTKVVEIENAQIRTYMGNYSDYSEKKAQFETPRDLPRHT